MTECSELYHLKASVFHDVKKNTQTGQKAQPTALKEGSTAKVKTIDINDAHKLYGHLNYGILKPMLKNRGYVLVDNGEWAEMRGLCLYQSKGKEYLKSNSR